MNSKLDIDAFHLTDKRRDLSLLARAAGAAERYDDMYELMLALVRDVPNGPLTVEERTLLGTAYRQAAVARRAALSSLSVATPPNASLLDEYKRQVEAELSGLCRDVLDLLTNKGLLLSPTELREVREELAAYLEE